MPAPLISVVMPAYNHERFITRTIKSVLEQSYPNLELIIVNDGSTDNTETTIKNFSDPRIRYFAQENQDAYNALNNGISYSRGEFIAIINSDDLFTTDRLERLLQQHHDCGARFVFSDVEPIDDEDRSLEDLDHPWNHWHRANRNYYFENNDLYRGFLHGNFMVTTSNIFMTRELADKVGKFAPLRYLHDYDYVFRLLLEAEQDSVYLRDERLLRYRIHAGNTLSEAAITGREQDREVIRRYLFARLQEPGLGYARTAVDRLIALEHELIQVRRQLNPPSAPPPAPPASLTRRAVRRFRNITRQVKSMW